jgi:polar amino acid transport system substrate-binding protein
MITGNPPMTFADDSGKLVGYDEDLAVATMQVLGLKYEFVKTQFDTIIPGLQSGRYPVTFVSLNPTADRLKVIDMVPFSTTSAVFVTKGDYAGTVSGSADVCGKKVAAVTASSQYALLTGLEKECTAAGKPAIDITQLPGVSESTLAVKSGQADMFAIAGTYAAYMTAHDTTLKTQPYKFGSALSGAATGKNSPFADAIAAAMNVMIHNGSYAQILAKWNVGDIAIDTVKVMR